MLTFHLKSKKEKDSLILMEYIPSPRQRVRVSTGQKVPPGQWNVRERRARTGARLKSNKALNMLLDKIEQEVKKLDRECRANNGAPPSAEEVKEAVYKATGRVVERKEENSFLEFFAQEIERRRKLPGFSPTRVRQYEVFLDHLGQFSESYYPLRWDNINLEWFDHFQDYSFNVKGHSNNTLVKHIKILKSFMKRAVQAGLTDNMACQGFKVKEDVPVLTYFTMQEVERIRALDLAGNERLAKMRDRAIVGAFTGMRFSDLDQLTVEHFTSIRDREGKKVDAIRFMQSKTKQVITIPLHPFVKETIERNGGVLPSLSHQKSNKYLKELCQLAGIDSPVTIVRNKAGQTVSETLPKWDAVTTHTLRATAATNLYKMGVPAKTIMKFGGWRDEKVFQRYIRLADEEHTVIVAKSDYFKVRKEVG
ncbi:MAG: site-specific integrase [Phaeodactylibacter sp.]|nr:site-specific integrase [Phaeodactylibacter sp.]MCB9291681.1 site-specific integrase [Lewinellaceae bacterium]